MLSLILKNTPLGTYNVITRLSYNSDYNSQIEIDNVVESFISFRFVLLRTLVLAYKEKAFFVQEKEIYID